MDIRKAILAALPEESSTYGTATEPQYIYIPGGHEKSLRLYSTLIVGARGVGKSFWTAALENPDLRKIIQNRVPELENTDVYKGFGIFDSPDSSKLSVEVIKDLLDRDFGPYQIWQTVILRWLREKLDRRRPAASWRESAEQVRENPELWINTVKKANTSFKSSGKNGLILFDALDRTSDNWERMDHIVRELLRLVLRLKEYSNIFVKVFLRDDQYKRKITNFPDASKLMATHTELTWQMHDLHGLLWQRFCNAPGKHGKILRSLYKEVMGKYPNSRDSVWILDHEAKQEGIKQRTLFERLAGPWMGKDKRRGVPYIWSVGHLADGNRRTSPRSFLTAIRAAAEYSMDKENDYPLHYDGIKQGVQKASIVRLGELINEDYPWVNDIVTPLQEMNVPIDFETIKDRWQKQFPEGYRPSGLPPEHLDQGWHGIRDDLIQLGIFEKMYDGRINMPDLYRVGFRLGRKGGVKPVK
jgi:hypothetical protein